MRFLLRTAALLTFAVLFSAALPADEKKTDKNDKTTNKSDKTSTKSDKKTDKTDKDADSTDTEKPAAKPKKTKQEKFDYKNRVSVGGKLTKVDGSTKNFTVEVTITYVDPQRDAENKLFYARRISEIRGVQNPQSARIQLYELQLDMQKRAANSIEKKTKDVEFEADEKVKVRALRPPTEYDDSGNPKKHTKAELKTLKGPDTSLPGYTADFDQLKVGQMVTVYLAKMKTNKNRTAKKNTDDADLEITRPKGVMIVIVAEPPPQ